MDRTPGWERVAPVPLQTVCIRHVPAGATDEKLVQAHNLGIAMRVNERGRAYVTPSLLKGKQIIRVSVGATATERKDVELVWHELRQAAEARG